MGFYIFKFTDSDSVLNAKTARIVIININENPNFPKLLFFETDIGISSSIAKCLPPQFKHTIDLNYWEYC